MISESCRKCSGAGRIRIRKDIKVKIPPGVGKGSILRVAGEGDAGPKGYVIRYSCHHSPYQYFSDLCNQ